MRRPRGPDPELARQAGLRLAALLADGAPRRAIGPVPAEDEADSAQPEQRSMAQDRPPAPLPRRFGRAHLGVVGVLVLLGLLCAGWALLRARPVALASPGPVVSVSSPPSSPSPSPGASGAPERIVVHVLGAVRRPGLVRLPSGSRVDDAIVAAGGVTARADPGELNLAQVLADGEQVLIGTRGHPAGEVRDGEAGGGSSGGSTGGPGVLLDLNRATEAQLEELPGVGPVTAGKIIAWRTEHHRFSKVAELQEVDGIGPKTFARIAPHVRV